MSVAPISITGTQLSGGPVFQNGTWYLKFGQAFSLTVDWQGGTSPYGVAVTMTFPLFRRLVTVTGIIGETNATISIPGTRFNFIGNGSLTVSVGGGAGSGPNVQAIIPFEVRDPSDPIFGGPPQAVLQSVTVTPSTSNPALGQTVTFLVRALSSSGTASPGVDITVFENNVQIIGGLTTDAGGTAVFSRTYNDVGQFSVFARGNGTVTSPSVTITVTDTIGPTPVDVTGITVTPGTTVNSGQAQTFTIEHTGTAVSYAWKIDGQDLGISTKSMGPVVLPVGAHTVEGIAIQSVGPPLLSDFATVAITVNAANGGPPGTGGDDPFAFLKDNWLWLAAGGALLFLLPVGREKEKKSSSTSTRVYIQQAGDIERRNRARKRSLRPRNR